jgi:hypothetical protein
MPPEDWIHLSGRRAGMMRTVYGAVFLFVLVAQAAFSAWACHYLAESRPGASTRRWAQLGWLLGPGAIFVTWWFAGRGSGTRGLDEMRRLRQTK